jgi:hypothetical protein
MTNSDSFIRNFLANGVPDEHRSVINGAPDALAPPCSRVRQTPRFTHSESFVEPTLAFGVASCAHLLGNSNRDVLAVPRLRPTEAPPSLLFVNALATTRCRTPQPAHARAVCLWTSRSSARTYALAASHHNRARLIGVPLDRLAALSTADATDDYLDRVLARAAVLSMNDVSPIVHVAAQTDVPSLSDLPTPAFVATVIAAGDLCVLRPSEQLAPVERILVDHEATAPQNERYLTASFAHRSAAMPVMHAVTSAGQLQRLVSHDGDRLVIESKAVLPDNDTAVYAAPTVAQSNAIVCSRRLVYSIDWRAPQRATGIYASRLLRRWPRRPEEGPALPALPHRITALATSSAYHFATALEDDQQRFACVELWDERNREAPIDRWRWPTGREWALPDGDPVHRGHDVDALGGAPSSLVFVTNSDSSQIELFAVDGSRTRVAVLRATGAGLEAPTVAPDVALVPTFWESLRHAVPFATSSADAWSTANPRGIESVALVARDGIERASGPLLHGIAVTRVDNETLACVQLTSDGDVYRSLMTRSSREPIVLEPRSEVCARLEAVRCMRDISRVDHVYEQHRKVASVDHALASAIGHGVHSGDRRGDRALARAIELLQQHPCTLDELVRELQMSTTRLVALLARGEHEGTLASTKINEDSGDALLDQLQTVYYVPGSEANLAMTMTERAAHADETETREVVDVDSATADRTESQVLDDVLTQMSQPFLDDDAIAAQERATARQSVIDEELERRRGRRRMFVPDDLAINKLARDWHDAFKRQR